MRLPQYEISNIERSGGTITISARYTGPISCPHCGGSHLRHKGWCRRRVRHDDWGFRRGILDLQVRKSRCLDCGRSFRQRLPGIQPYQRASEGFQEMVYQQHLDGINRSCPGRRKGIGAATVQRYFLRHLQRRARQDHAPLCPKVLGIDEHFFTRKKGYATTFCDLKNHRLACWREIDPAGSKNRGLISLMRRHRHNLQPDQKLRLSAYLAEHPALRAHLSLQTATLLPAAEKA